MDYESEHSRALGCWDAGAALTPVIQMLTSSEPTPDFQMPPPMAQAVVDGSMSVDADLRGFWLNEIVQNYRGDDGRKRLRMAAMNLRDRDGLLGRLGDVRCPVLWMHVCFLLLQHMDLMLTCTQGTADATYSVAAAEEAIQLFLNSPEAKLVTVEGGMHFLNVSKPFEVNAAVLEFVCRWHK
jgi:hypothetical protein